MKRVLPFVLLLTIAACSQQAEADDFCIESTVTIGKQATKNMTIFRSGRVYDFLDNPNEITIFDPPGNRFVVLNPARRVKVEISLSEIEQSVFRQKSNAIAQNVPLLSFLANPSFEESYDESTGELVMTSEWLKYHVKTVTPKLSEAARQYAEFSDWQTKLNTVLNPDSLPPFPRLALNAAIAKSGRLPVEVERTHLSPEQSRKSVTIRADHRLQWRVLESDAKRLDEANTFLVTFKSVSLSDYR
jgi:hypothetical protein